MSNYYLQEYFPRVPGLAPDIQGCITGMYKVNVRLVDQARQVSLAHWKLELGHILPPTSSELYREIGLAQETSMRWEGEGRKQVTCHLWRRVTLLVPSPGICSLSVDRFVWTKDIAIIGDIAHYIALVSGYCLALNMHVCELPAENFNSA